MATVCDLAAEFDEPLTYLYEMFRTNALEAENWGTRWDIVRDEAFRRADGALVRQVWGHSSAYARMDGMGGYVSYMLQFVGGPHTEITVTVSSPYHKRGHQTDHDRRCRQVALRLLEFCVAPYEEIHPRVGTLKRIADGVRVIPSQNPAT